MSQDKKFKKQANTTSTQPLYKNPSGEIITPSDIITKKKTLSKDYKPASMSEIVSNPNFGKKK